MKFAKLAPLLSGALAIVSLIGAPSRARSSGPSVFAPIRLIGGDEQKTALGRNLFFDRRLSRSMRHSCASCHDLATNGATNTRVDHDDSGQALPLNTPTLFNSIYNFRFGWAGKRRTMRDMVYEAYRDVCKGEGVAPARLAADRSMSRAFRAVYRSAPEDSDIVDALAAFISTLVTPDATFDRWLEGDTKALTAQQLRGYRRFTSLGCSGCHQGQNVGGNIVARRGIFHPLGSPNPRRLRVPSLRNVAVTAPYFHDGSAPTLPDAIRQMSHAQLDVTISGSDARDIAAFLRSLTGIYRGRPPRPATSGRK